MAASPVPVTVGCTRFRSADVGGFHVAGIHFPGSLHLPLHTHQRATVAVILRGCFDGLTAGGSHSCPIGSIVTEPAGEPHGNVFARTGATVLVIQPDPDQGELLEPFSGLLGQIGYQRDSFVAGLAQRAASELSASDAVAPFALEGLVLELLAVTARARDTNRNQAGRPPPRWLDEARSLLHDRSGERLRVSEVAAAVGVHPVHLSRQFRAHYGTPMGGYLRTLRLQEAAQRLVNSDATLADIALAVGFFDQSHFAREFKRQFGVTPLAYRHATNT
jgi:AraC family transcriptional regulator